jgi:anti-sigma factor RsiW
MAATIEIKACAELEQDLVLYYYGELDSAGRTRVESHMKTCAGCRASLKAMRTILPLTADYDEPPETFWSAYAREMRHKLAEIDDRKPWWRRLAGLPRSQALPAFAACAAIAIALVLTLDKGWMTPSDVPVSDQALLEALPVAEHLDFFRHMELLDAIELLESTGTANEQV